MFGRKNFTILFQPAVAAFLASTFLFGIIVVFFRIGYVVDDDISAISLVSGYLGGTPLPFLAHSNVLLGLFLSPLYGLAPTINWEVVFFIVVNFISVWGLVYTLLSRLEAASLSWFATGAVLLCDAYFLLNITYTMIAAFAAIAGLCLVMTGVQSHLPLKKGLFVPGVVLVLLAGLIRFKAMLLVGGLILPVLVFFIRRNQLKRQLIAFTVLGMLVLGCTIFDGLYLQRMSPAWYSFGLYDAVRTQLHDTPRKANVQAEITARVGWSSNDTRDFFTNWFFPDRKIYSIENLQYLVDHIPGTQPSKLKTLTALLSSLASPVSWPYLLIVFSLGLSIWFYGLSKRVILPLLTLLVTFFGLGFYLSWTMKFPDRILLSLLAGVAIFGLYILIWAGMSGTDALFRARESPKALKAYLVGMFIFSALTLGVVCYQSVETTKVYVREQAAYQNILVDLKGLQDRGSIRGPSLIISPAYGMPLAWANPLTMNYPPIQVLEMGWLTFSPAYEKVLAAYGAQSMPDALYMQDNVYLMVPGSSLRGVTDFIKEHRRVAVDALLIYTIPGTQVNLYKLQPRN